MDGGRNGVKGESGASDDELASDVLSHYSSASESASVVDEATGGAKTRLAALDSLGGAFSSKLLYDFLIERRLTVSDCLERSLRKGETPQHCVWVVERSRLQRPQCAAQLCVQLGGGDEGEEGFKILRPVLSAIMIDGCASVSARQSCARALGMCCYVSAAEDGEDLVKSMSHWRVYSPCRTPTARAPCPPPMPVPQGLHSAALHFWALLVTLCPASRLNVLLDLHLPKLQACLESSDVNYRIAVGETIALLVELGRDIDREFEFEDSDTLCECLKGLATDGNKHHEDFSEEKIRFGVEGIYIDSWMRRRVYDAFKEVLESGHLFNSAAFKARTKLRNKVRDKRADVM
ncbi:interferon-related developmental regulator 2 [Salmo trutta]|uniref:interferon-related developmental regulator 2 n=1 Tax=Salmo trutta TaxID=8032 RepID=UPI0011311358|nr:interferon-related developmental regulator 2-like [Salmo trutta]